ncbi:unnamed protein product [Ilex paraguariensis]|uniref:RNase H type-1 domain-containing protein n=1 Tax=Ilex paraguariensis TaxID=185542 RepID=A0ABC8UT69_9AQUA
MGSRMVSSPPTTTIDSLATNSWVPPASDQLKLNCDGAVKHHQQQSVIGIVIRNERGILLNGKTMQIPTVSSLYAEAVVVRETTVMVQVLGLNKTIVESGNADLYNDKIGNSFAEEIARDRSVSCRKLVQHSQFVGFNCASSLARLAPYLSDSSSDENTLHIQKNASVAEQFSELNTHQVIQILNDLRKEPSLALSFFSQLKKHGFKHDVGTYMAIIRILCSWGMDRRLDSILFEVIGSKNGHLGFDIADLFEALEKEHLAEGPNSLVKAFDALVKLHVSAGMFYEAIDILFRTRGFLPHILTFNFLMNRLVEHGKVDMAVSIYKQLKRLGLSPNVYTYVILIKAYCRKGSLEEAFEVFEEMTKAGVAPSAFTYTTFIEGLCSYGMTILGYEMLLEWRGENAPIDMFAYAVVIRGFVREKKLKEAKDVLLDMEDQGLVPDAYCYGALIQGYCESGSTARALDAHQEMAAKGIKTNCMILSSILQCLCQMGLASEAVDHFQKFKDLGIFLDGVTYNTAIDSFCKLGRMEEAVRLLDEMKGQKIVPDVVHYTTLMNGYCNQWKLPDALNLFENMKDEGLKPDFVTFNVLASGFSRNGLAQKTINLLDHMMAQRPDPITYNIIIEGLCIRVTVEEAKMFLSCLEVRRLDDYAAKINGYSEANSTKEAFELFDRRQQGVLVRKTSCLKLLSNLCMEGDMGKARQVFDYMIQRGLTPDVVTYTRMLKGYCHVRCLQEACGLFRDMKARCIEPDVICYTALIDSHCKSDNLQDAEGLFNEMIDRGLEPDIVTYTVLLCGYFRQGYVDRAVILFDEMSSKGIEPDSYFKSALQCGILKANKV